MSLARSGEEADEKLFEDYYNNLIKVLNKNDGILYERKYNLFFFPSIKIKKNNIF